MWYGLMRYQVCLECSWIINCYPTYGTLRDAWAYIEKYVNVRKDA